MKPTSPSPPERRHPSSLADQPAPLPNHRSAPRASVVLSTLIFHFPPQSPSGLMLTCARGTGAVGTRGHLGPICREKRDGVKGLQGGKGGGVRAKSGRHPAIAGGPHPARTLQTLAPAPAANQKEKTLPHSFPPGPMLDKSNLQLPLPHLIY